MKNLKKLISVIIAVIMIVGSFATVSAADYKDVESTNSFYKAIKVLSGLGIVNGDDEGNFNPKNDIKRSEMVALVCRMMGEEDIATNSASNAFTDVAANHWAAGNIAWGVNRGIINGMGDGTFAPDASVSYQDAVVMIMRALGYDRIAQRVQYGGYPTGYLRLASQYGVLKDAGYDNQAAAPREVVAQLIYNALTAALVDFSSYGENVEDDKFIVYSGANGYALRTLLTYKNEIYKVKADITASAKADKDLIDKDGNYKVNMRITNGFGYDMDDVYEMITGITAGNVASFALNGVYVAETDAADLLGATVEAYIVKDEDLAGAWKLLAVVADEKSVKSETIKAAEVDFKGYTTGITVDKFTYEDADGQKEEIELVKDDLSTTPNESFTVYYNGKEVAKSDQFGDSSATPPVAAETVINTLMMGAEEITFTGPRTGDYNKVFITDYAYHQVDKVYVEDLYIKADGLDLELDPVNRANNKKFTYGLFDGNGNEISIEDIAEDDILNIVAPLEINPKTGATVKTLGNVDYMDIYVTSNVVTGAVDEWLDGGKYAINDNVYKMVSGSIPSSSAVEGEFYITIDGRILTYDNATSIAKDFGFIVEAYSAPTYVGSTTYDNVIRLFTAEGKLVSFEVADRLTVKGSATNISAGIYSDSALDTLVGTDISALAADKATAADAQAALAERVVTYKLNADGEIREIMFAGNSDGITSSYATNKAYRDDINTFGTKKIADNSVLFVAPVEETDPGVSGVYNVKERKLKIGNFNAMDEDKSNGYKAATYVFDTEAKTLAAAVVGETIDSNFAGTRLAVVKARGTVSDPEFDYLVKYTLIQGGETITLTVSGDPSGSVSTLNAGDVFRYAVDAEGNIDDMQVIYTASTATFNQHGLTVGTLGDDATHSIALVYGDIYAIEDGVMTIDTDPAEDNPATTNVVENLTAFDRLLGEGEGNTYASINEDGNAAAIDGNDVTMLRSSASLRASAGTRTYRVIAVLTEDDVFEDCVMIIE